MWQTADLFQRRVGTTDQDIILFRHWEAEEP